MRLLKFAGALTAGVLLVLAVAWVLSSQNGDYVFDLEVGQCFEEPPEWTNGDGTEVVNVDVVDCDDVHDAEVIGRGELNPDGGADYPSDDELFAAVDARCAAIQGLPLDRFGIVPVAPTVATWRTLDGRYLCVALPFGGDPTRGRISGD